MLDRAAADTGSLSEDLTTQAPFEYLQAFTVEYTAAATEQHSRSLPDQCSPSAAVIIWDT